MSEPTPLSASSVNTYLKCGRKWHYTYVLQVQRPPTMKQARGIALHSAVEINYLQKQKTGIDLPIQDVMDAYATEFDKETADIESIMQRASLPEGKDSGIQMTRRYQIEVAPSVQPAMVEEPIAFDLVFGGGLVVPWTGTIDLVDQFGNVRDTKSTSRKPHAEDYQLNMTGYSLGYRQKTSEIENEIVLDYIVATSRPYYLPIRSGGPVTDRDIATFADTVEDVLSDINAGRFPANGIRNGSCSWCEFRDICTYRRK